MTDIVKMLDPGTQVIEAFVYGVGRIDHMGGVSRIVFFAPTRLDQECVNEVVLKLIVPTEQLAKIAPALVQPRGPRSQSTPRSTSVTRRPILCSERRAHHQSAARQRRGN
jgi:hypothetical protein